MVRFLALLLAIGLTCGTAHAQLPEAVTQALRAAGLPDDALSVTIIPAQGLAWPRGIDGARAHHARRPMQPASTMKVVTAAVALAALGVDFRGGTDLLATGPIENGVLRGDLILRGGGDPDLSWEALADLLRQARARGVQTVAGDIVIDRMLFTPTRLDTGVPPIDESPEWQYNVIPDALHLNGNLLAFTFESDAASVRARITPALEGITIASRMTLAATACADWDDGWQPAVVTQTVDAAHIELQGSFPQNCSAQADLNLLDRALVAALGVRKAWTDAGGALQGRVREANAAAPKSATVLASRRSRPLGEFMRGMMKDSDNPLTRLTYLHLGAQGNTGAADTREAAGRRVAQWFARQRIDGRGIVIDNGSGLSRSERISTDQLAGVLKAAWAANTAPEFLASLPIAGVDGTMRRRLKDSAAAGRARIKTGTLKNAVAVAGYVPDANDRMWIVAAIVNHENAARGRAALDALIDSVARMGAALQLRGDRAGGWWAP
jgi:serine-type D-Ala-D-Ala carboxypeptidase/endopeptidase (penicillin-binding protein 4)